MGEFLNEREKRARARSISETMQAYGVVKQVLLTLPPSGTAKIARAYAKLTLQLFLK